MTRTLEELLRQRPPGRIVDVVARMEQVAEGLASVDPVAELAEAKHVRMPILEQVRLVLDGGMDPRDIAPHLTTDDEPIEE